MNELMQRAIDGMSSPESETRAVSATEIYKTGRALADHAAYPWWGDDELAALLNGNEPKMTIGLAVTPERFERIHEASGLPRLSQVPPDQDALEFELHFPGGLSMDILTSKDPAGAGAIAKFLQKFGEGIQQIEYLCKDVDRATQILKTKFNVPAIYPETRSGADGTRINFFLVSAPDSAKVLIELYEPAPRLD
ncbi:MAG TPA: hypothetical protein VNY24_09525 [Candidatus Acidoferrales bacterium]|jgi:hypothetical protein|nr:hypothetical protein [Candidatus Acidoferrales bacterium]